MSNMVTDDACNQVVDTPSSNIEPIHPVNWPLLYVQPSVKRKRRDESSGIVDADDVAIPVTKYHRKTENSDDLISENEVLPVQDDWNASTGGMNSPHQRCVY